MKSIEAAKAAAQREKERLARVAEEEKRRAEREEAERARKEHDAPLVEDMLKDVRRLLGEMGSKGDSGGLDFKRSDGTKVLFEKGDKDSAPVDTRVKGKSKLDAEPLPALEFKTEKDAVARKKPKTEVPPPHDISHLFAKKPSDWWSPKNPLTDPGLIEERAKREAQVAEMDAAYRLLQSPSYQDWFEDQLTAYTLRRLQGKSPEALNAARKKIIDRENAAMVQARHEALEAMEAEYAGFQKRGLLKEGDDLVKKTESDAAFREALTEAAARVLENFNRKRSEITDRSIREMATEIERLAK